MVFRFRIVSDEVTNFCREIEIDADASFLQLRNAILDCVDYTKDEMSSFYLCNDEWEKNEEVTLEDMGSASDEDIWIMEDTPLSELIEDEGQHIAFVFDYLTERCFYMELKEVITGRTMSDPLCTRKEGKAPAQFIEPEEIEEHIEKKAALSLPADDFDSEFYGDSDFNDDELAEGFDDLNFN